jgi:hyperosmotically inducible periplasmic protein
MRVFTRQFQTENRSSAALTRDTNTPSGKLFPSLCFLLTFQTPVSWHGSCSSLLKEDHEIMKPTIKKLGLLTLWLSAGTVFAESARTEADNTGKNKRDRNDQTLTSEDQAQGTDRDVELTRKIRQALTKKEDLSTDAKNVKIITLKSKVTLRGPVKSEAERQEVVGIACDIAGTKNVKNELEIAH